MTFYNLKRHQTNRNCASSKVIYFLIIVPFIYKCRTLSCFFYFYNRLCAKKFTNLREAFINTWNISQRDFLEGNCLCLMDVLQYLLIMTPYLVSTDFWWTLITDVKTAYVVFMAMRQNCN